jgi:hypothetical protein
MSKVIQVTYAEESSVRVEDFRYVKPRFEMTATVGENEKKDDVIDALVAAVKARLRNMEKQIYREYKGLLKSGDLK